MEKNLHLRNCTPCLLICEIDTNEGDERQEIYWSLIDNKLHTNFDGSIAYDGECSTVEDAQNVAAALWSNGWNLDWIEN